MQHLMPRPRRRSSVSVRARKMIATAWMIASLTLPIAGIVAITQGVANLAPGDPTFHTVKAGETLTAIALRYGVSVDEVVQANGLSNPNYLYVGQQLAIPNDAPAGGQIHTIQVGESLSMIARRYGVTVDALVAANGLTNRNSIIAGQKLIISGSTVEQLADAPSLTYTLRRGDSLYRVALIFGVTVDDVLAANHLANPNAIFPGLVLRIPTSPGDVPVAAPGDANAGDPQTGGRTVTVGLGDTLSQIAIRNSVTVDGLIAANGITDPTRIYVGQVLNLPEAGQTARPAPALTAVTHRVVVGQTLTEIALRYGVTVQSLAVANGIINTARIYEGQVLTIPSAQVGSNSIAYASYGAGLCTDVSLLGTGTGYFIRPTRGYITTQEFHPWHPGMDLASDTGTSIFAADSGTVIYAGWNPVGYGNLIILDHGNGWRSYYAHLSKIDVGCGMWIPRASIMGEVGSTGNSTGPHLHFEMLRYGIAVNPEGYIRFP
jgi:murein DD-endopeptidase MepM/ murein hydrolase activator NlpD